MKPLKIEQIKSIKTMGMLLAIALAVLAFGIFMNHKKEIKMDEIYYEFLNEDEEWEDEWEKETICGVPQYDKAYFTER